MNIAIKYILLLLFLTNTLFSQEIGNLQTKDKTTNWPEPVFEHFTVADGLPENSVRCILQDHLGYMWFGTQNGLARYDGYEMKVYQPDLKDSLSISDRQIITIYEDKSGTVWIGTQGGLNRFNRTTETFKSYLHIPEDSTSINSNYVLSIYEDKTGNLLVGTLEGLNLFNRHTEKFRHIYYQGSVYSASVYKYISSLIDGGKTISSILQVGNNADFKKTFTINKKTVVVTVVMGEAGFDEGWLESSDGKLITGKFNNKVLYARGNIRRYINSVFQVFIDTLNSGSYRLRYKSDYGWSYNQWGETPPTYPEFWGIQVIELPDDKRNIQEILSDIQPAVLNYRVGAIIEDHLTGKIFLGSNNKILVYDGGTETLAQENKDLKIGSELGKIQSFWQSVDGSIWIGHTKGLARFNSLNNTLENYQPIPSFGNKVENELGNLTEDENGFIWSSHRNWTNNSGLVCFDPKSGSFRIYKSDPVNQTSLSTSIIASVYKDNSGVLWVGTGWGGVNKWDKNKYKFKRFSSDAYNSNSEPFNLVYTIIEDQKGIIWFGNENGLNSFNRFSNEFKNYKYTTKDESKGVNYIYKDESDIIWFGTTAKGLGKFNPSNGSFQFYSNNPNDSTTISNNNVSFILPDKNDILWIGTWGGGLNKFNKSTENFSHFVHDQNDSLSLSSNQVTSIYKDRQGILWIGTNGGELNKFDKNNNTFKSFDLEGFGTCTILAIYEDHKGNFWGGTFQTGIYLFDRSQNLSVYNITEKDGLANNCIRSILEDKSGSLWIGTANGLSKFDPVTNNIKSYFSSKNFDENRYWRNSAFKTLTGEMLFGTSDGFIMFHPDSIKNDPTPPQVVISNVSLFNRPDENLEYEGFISEMKELNLSYNENDLRFDYVGLHYGDPSKNKYKYMLEGYDNDWINAVTQRNATYTNLDAGEYTFRVTACNADGVWNEEGASLKVVISPPYWATWWAYGFYLIIFGSILYGIRKYEMNRQLWKHRMELETVEAVKYKEINRMKSHFFANISHEFRTPLTLILGPSENILTEAPSENTIKQAGAIKRNANRLLLLISQLLDLSKLEAGKLELKASKANIVPFIKGFTMSFESLAEGKDITLKVSAEKEQIELYFDKEKMIKIMSNLLSNAFKFTQEGGYITVTISEKNLSSVDIKVGNNGTVVAKEKLSKLFDRFYQVDDSNTREHEGTGIGLALVKELVELHQGTISVDSEPGDPNKAGTGWTEFIIELPLGRKHLRNYEIIEDEVSTDEVIMSYAESGARKLNEFDILDSSRQQDGQASSISNRTTQNDSEADEDKTLILVVEDNADVREFIKDSLGKEFQIEEASNGEQGVKKAEQIIPDLIISDIMMPKMDGNELTRILKNDEKTSHIPIILLTAKSEQQSKLEGLETGADDYLTKPFDTKELQIRIKNLINIRRRLQEKYSRIDFIPLKKEVESLTRPGEARAGKLSNLEEQFMCNVIEVIEKHLSEEEFSIEQFGKEVGMSRMQLHRKLKALTGKSASNYLRSVRLNKAKLMIEEQKGNISEIAYAVGFSSPQYFTRSFKEEFGYPPSDLL